MNPDDNKTPRDWLLARHAAASPRLDALRRAALPPPALSWGDFLREVFRPHRTAWRALAAAWVVLALFHLARPTPAPAPQFPAPSPAALAKWLAQLKSNETLAQIDRHP